VGVGRAFVVDDCEEDVDLGCSTEDMHVQDLLDLLTAPRLKNNCRPRL
jgi:hypothetical protein